MDILFIFGTLAAIIVLAVGANVWANKGMKPPRDDGRMHQGHRGEEGTGDGGGSG